MKKGTESISHLLKSGIKSPSGDIAIEFGNKKPKKLFKRNGNETIIEKRMYR